MEKITVKVEIPVGYDLIINGTDCKLVPKKVELPKTWEEFCKMNLVNAGEYYVNNYSDIVTLTSASTMRNPFGCRNLLPNLETAEAMRALCQLIQLRNCYNGDWMPDWSHCTEKYVIVAYFNDTRGKVIIDTDFAYYHPRVLTFKSKELRDLFLENFLCLIEIAKPLL